MKRISNKLLLAAGLIALASSAYAAPMATLNASITSIGALNATNVAPLNFGSWLMTGAGTGGEELVFVKSVATGAVSVTPGATSTAVSIVANAVRAQQTVDIPGGTSTEDGLIIDVTYNNLVPFGDNNAVLSDIVYQTANQAATPMTSGVAYPVTIAAGATPEPVYFGATITVDGAIPNGANTASIDVTYNY